MSDKRIEAIAKKPDTFLKTLKTGYKWGVTHSQMVIGALALFFILGGGFTLWDHLKKDKEMTLQEEYYSLERGISDKKKAFSEAKAKLPEKGETKPVATVENYDTDYLESVNKLQELALKNPGSRAALMAALQAVDLMLEFKKDKEALDFLMKVDVRKISDLLDALVVKQLGNIQANLGECNLAIASWNRVIVSKTNAFLYPDIRLRQALCYETLKDVAQAEKIYIELTQVTPGENSAPEENDLSAAKEAEKYLRLLQLKKGT